MFTTPRKRNGAPIVEQKQEGEQILEYSGDLLQVLSPTLKPFHSAKKARNSLGDAARIFSPTKSASSSKMEVDTESRKENSVNLLHIEPSRHHKSSAIKANEHATPFSPRADTSRSVTPLKRAVTPSRRPMTPSKPTTPF
ncbi:hypothetical protein EON65_49280, partial [archaeon]